MVSIAFDKAVTYNRRGSSKTIAEVVKPSEATAQDGLDCVGRLSFAKGVLEVVQLT